MSENEVAGWGQKGYMKRRNGKGKRKERKQRGKESKNKWERKRVYDREEKDGESVSY